MIVSAGCKKIVSLKWKQDTIRKKKSGRIKDIRMRGKYEDKQQKNVKEILENSFIKINIKEWKNWRKTQICLFSVVTLCQYLEI